MKKTITLLLFAVLALTGCSSIDSGLITKKSYTAPYETTEDTCHMRDSKTNICTMKTSRQKHHAATYKFDLKSSGKEGWAYVNENDYNNHKVGDCWSC